MFSSPYFYYLTVALQLICVIHCLKKGSEQKWIYIIIFLPVIGCIAYAYTEMFNKRDISKVQSGIGSVFNPSGTIKKLEQNLQFSDTFNNRILLADAYLATGQTDRAIELYKSSLTGAFDENEHVQSQLMQAYFAKEDYDEVIRLGQKMYKQPQFARSTMHLLFARALAYSGHLEQAEKEFKMMSGRFANYEARYYFATILLKTDRAIEGTQLLQTMVDEASHLSSMERSANKLWFSKAKGKLKEVAV
jgi:hypothetical protein